MCVLGIIEEWDSYATGKLCRLMVIEFSILVMFQLKEKEKGRGLDEGRQRILTQSGVDHLKGESTTKHIK